MGFSGVVWSDSFCFWSSIYCLPVVWMRGGELAALNQKPRKVIRLGHVVSAWYQPGDGRSHGRSWLSPCFIGPALGSPHPACSGLQASSSFFSLSSIKNVLPSPVGPAPICPGSISSPGSHHEAGPRPITSSYVSITFSCPLASGPASMQPVHTAVSGSLLKCTSAPWRFPA